MKILHTVEFYSPSVGGAQEVVKQISERLVSLGHDVTVATAWLPGRTSRVINGVKIEEFTVTGNAVRGYIGENRRYQRFLQEFPSDVMMNYAAQQWATDLAFPVLERLAGAKLLAPCGFSGLYRPEYRDYFQEMPDVLRRYDRLIFHSDSYQDIAFSREHGLTNLTVIPNACGEDEFSVVDPTFRARYGIPEDLPLLLTVGSHTALKGHREALTAFAEARIGRAVLVVIGNVGSSVPPPELPPESEVGGGALAAGEASSGGAPRLVGRLGAEGWHKMAREAVRRVVGRWRPAAEAGCLESCRTLARHAERISRGDRRVLLLDAPRPDVVAAFQAADLFLFPSNVECSPLVLFEAMATRTPFLASDCGNAAEIARWGGGGRVLATRRRRDGFVEVPVPVLRRGIEELVRDAAARAGHANAGYRSWQERFTWEKVVSLYARAYEEATQKRRGIA